MVDALGRDDIDQPSHGWFFIDVVKRAGNLISIDLETQGGKDAKPRNSYRIYVITILVPDTATVQFWPQPRGRPRQFWREIVVERTFKFMSKLRRAAWIILANLFKFRYSYAYDNYSNEY